MRAEILTIGSPEEGMATLFRDTVEGVKGAVFYRYGLCVKPAALGGSWFTRMLRRLLLPALELPLVEVDDDRYVYHWYSEGQLGLYTYSERDGQLVTTVDLDGAIHSQQVTVNRTGIECTRPPRIIDINGSAVPHYLMAMCEDEAEPEFYLIGRHGEIHEGVVSDVTHIGNTKIDFTIAGEASKDYLVQVLGDRYVVRINGPDAASSPVSGPIGEMG